MILSRTVCTLSIPCTAHGSRHAIANTNELAFKVFNSYNDGISKNLLNLFLDESDGEG